MAQRNKVKNISRLEFISNSPKHEVLDYGGFVWLTKPKRSKLPYLWLNQIVAKAVSFQNLLSHFLIFTK